MFIKRSSSPRLKHIKIKYIKPQNIEQMFIWQSKDDDIVEILTQIVFFGHNIEFCVVKRRNKYAYVYDCKIKNK